MVGDIIVIAPAPVICYLSREHGRNPRLWLCVQCLRGSFMLL